MDDDSPLLDNHDIIESSNERNGHKSIESLREWFIWSYLNIIFGSVILGIIAIGCSLRTDKFKGRQDYAKARKWSYITLIISIEQKQMVERKSPVGLIYPKQKL
ncbi:unnamed protein product [Rotaria sp. Silwood2]|nr:unnamed protein product [Rotaria sp. Silwood2]